jgi:hypothetical protein
MISATGSDGTVNVHGDIVTITRKGLMGKLQTATGNGNESFSLKEVAGIGFKSWSMVTGKGHLQFGLVEADGSAHWSDTFLGNAGHDKHTLVFGMAAQKDFEAVRDYCVPLIGGAEALKKATVSAGSELSYEVQLGRLAELRDLGVLSDEEFEREKKKLLE